MKPLHKGPPYSDEWFARVAENEGVSIEEVRNRVNKAHNIDLFENAGPHPFWKITLDDDGEIRVGMQSLESIALAMKLLTGTPPAIIPYKVLFDDKQP